MDEVRESQAWQQFKLRQDYQRNWADYLRQWEAYDVALRKMTPVERGEQAMAEVCQLELFWRLPTR